MTSGLFVWPLRIYYEDTDVSGVVYHANYLRFFERARTEWLRALGCSQETLRQDANAAFTVSSLEIVFRQPARLDDELEATVEVSELRRASVRFRQTLRDKAQPDRVLSTAEVRVACVDAATFRPRPLPDIFTRLSAESAAP
ncbi:MAG: tol-pal system-associated acyl-CoA thioesterase [Nevskia sp.]